MRKDLKQHLIVGFLIAVVVGFGLIKFTEILEPVAVLVGLVLAALAGWAKEYVYDKRRPGRHVVDKKDFQYTALGGVLGAVVLSGLCFVLRG